MVAPPARRRDLTRGTTIALASAVTLSFTAILVRHLTSAYQRPPLVVAFWRDLLVPVILVPVLAVARPGLLRIARSDWAFLVGYGFVLAIFNVLWTHSVVLNGAAVATVLVYSSSAFTALLGRWFLKERLDWIKAASVALGLGGCVLVAGALDPAAWQVNLFGILTGTISGLGYASYTLLGRSAARRGLNPWTVLYAVFGLAAGFLLILNFLPGGGLPGGGLPGTARRAADLLWLGDDSTGWALLVLLSGGPTLVGFGLYNASLTYLPSTVANLIVTLEPAFTAVIAYYLLAERLTAVQIGGGLLILSGVVLLRVHEGRRAGGRSPKRSTGGSESRGKRGPQGPGRPQFRSH